MIRTIFISIIFSLITKFSIGATFTVINTNESGAGSLRAAVLACLADPSGAPHIIQFQIPISDSGYNPETGVWIIVFTDELPVLTSGYITIDGTTQTAFAGNTNPNGPEIMLNGNKRTIEYCFSIQNASNILIKGLIINEFLYGIQIYGENAKHNKVVGCYLGTNHDGTKLMGNVNAIEIISKANNNQVGDIGIHNRNLISGNEYAGIRMSDSEHNLIINNWVGVDITGNKALRNYDGITMEGHAAYNQVGGSSPDSANVTSGNVAYGIDIFGVGCKGNIVRGNFIGTNATGTHAIPNTYGLLCDDRSHHNVIGGYLPGQGNLISGNTAFGAYFYNNGTSYMYLIGNKIGTDITGTYAIPNETGVHIDGASYANLVDKNLISGNLANGITLFGIYSDYNIIINNKIGTDISGNLPLGNGLHGILITQNSANNIIGGSVTNSNIIAHNGRNGIKIESFLAKNNLISCNSIYKNAFMGIEIFPVDGPNPNDPGDTDDGPNGMLNYPVIEGITHNQDSTVLWGSLDVQNPLSTKIEVYVADINDNYLAEGKQYLGFTYPNSQGNWSFSYYNQSTNKFYTTLAIDATQNTSEFSMEYPEQITYYTLTHSVVGSNGSLVAWSDGNVLNNPDSVVALSNIYFTAFPVDSTFIVKEWKINGQIISGNKTNHYMITAINENTDVTVEFEFNTSVMDNIANENLTDIYPNPISKGEILRIENIDKYKHLRIFDVSGKIIYGSEINAHNMHSFSIVAPQKSGIYFIELVGLTGIRNVKKLVVCE
jgi:hypothetical protein